MSMHESLNTSQPQLISTKELAKLIGYQPQTIRKWIHEDKLPEGLPRPKKIGTRHRWSLKEINEFVLQFSKKDQL
ncbi:helix-turn-helix transcriptional regulator [Yersinia kristensenii]|uniref:helix-turn-helix transcriptional regulator n=1 Tax=Yersinia kristensenii TaxID=28152 RepID=UPI0011A57926|nr:helix-turn-helix domain-containing protein [Yersinia kristensenii]